ncbi:C1QL4-like protein [Mya arenaria]|uniref:C1QL4-like protein n=1 Tax=Mya arenaria TaxID=6604 RepID=A0ABY7DQS3_MYAAR|nr:C1QL4-like protein [Mya arenaria]
MAIALPTFWLSFKNREMFCSQTVLILLILQIVNGKINAKDVTMDKTNELILTLNDVIYELKGRVDSLETEVTKLRHENIAQQEFIEQLRTEISVKGDVLNRQINHETNKSTTNNNNGNRVLSDVSSANAEEPSISFQPLPRARRAVANVAFSAYLSRTQSHVTNTDIKFDKVLLNDGQGYNAFTGAFTAPLSGVYMFSFYFDSRTLSFLQLVIDGVNQVDAVANRHVLNDFNDRKAQSMGGNTCIVHVDHGQAVQVRVYEIPDAEVASSDTFRLSTFSGMLLY